MPVTTILWTAEQQDPARPRVYLVGSDVVTSRAAVAARRSKNTFLAAPRAAVATPPPDRVAPPLVQRAPRPHRRRRFTNIYQHATFTAAAAAPDYAPRVFTQKPPRPPSKPRRFLYQHATFTAAAPPPDYRVRVLIQTPQKPRRPARTILARVTPQVVVVVPDRRPQVFIQIAPQPRRRPGAVTQLAGIPILPTGWRRPFIQTARRARRAGRIIVGRVIPFVVPPSGAAPPVTCSTEITLAPGRTTIQGLEPTTVTLSTAHTRINPVPSMTQTTETPSRTGADCG